MANNVWLKHDGGGGEISNAKSFRIDPCRNRVIARVPAGSRRISMDEAAILVDASMRMKYKGNWSETGRNPAFSSTPL